MKLTQARKDAVLDKIIADQEKLAHAIRTEEIGLFGLINAQTALAAMAIAFLKISQCEVAS